MKLLSRNMEAFCFMNVTRTADGQSGNHSVWTEGDSFSACAVSAQSRMQAAKNQTGQHANKQEALPEYTILTPRSVSLPFHAVIKRISDGRFFRVTSDPVDAESPKGAHLDLRMHSAEKWRLTGEVASQSGTVPATTEQMASGGETDDQS